MTLSFSNMMAEHTAKPARCNRQIECGAAAFFFDPNPNLPSGEANVSGDYD
jgi:hypothetical protein